MDRPWVVVRILALMASLVAGSAADLRAEQADTVRVAALSERWERILDRAEAYLAEPSPSEEKRRFLLKTIDAVQGEATEQERRAAGDLDAKRRLLDTLGPPPKEGEPPELPEVAATRRTMEETASSLRALRAQAQLALARAADLEDRFTADYRTRFGQVLLARRPTVLTRQALPSAGHAMIQAIGQIVTAPFRAVAVLSEADRRLLLVSGWPIGACAAGLAGAFVAVHASRRVRHLKATPEPDYSLRVRVAILGVVARALPVAATLGVIYTWVTLDPAPLPDKAATVIALVCFGLGFVVVATSLTAASLSVGTPAWRIVPLTDASARRLLRLGTALLLIFAVHRYLQEATPVALDAVDPAGASLFAVLYAAVTGVLILLMLTDSTWQELPIATPVQAEDPAAAAASDGKDDERPPLSGGRGWLVARRAFIAITLAAMAATIAGYQILGFYIIDNVLFFFVLLFLFTVLRRFGAEAIDRALGSAWTARRLTLSSAGQDRVRFWLQLVVDTVLFLAAVHGLLLNLGVPADILARGSRELFQGVTIGGVTLSPLGILGAMAVFAFGMVATRFVGNAVTERVLPHTSLDAGVRTSIGALIGYVGVAVSLALATVALGLDLSNVAIVAGALSVGIGFGLQNVVNNFVSGLILLIERPVKVGDWIKVGDAEGFVRRIQVRATEIETFNRASVIVPNSELISGTVVNLTHRDTIGRVEIQVGVAYGSDTAKVRDILLARAAAHPEVLSVPKPLVFFMAFGESSLDFELRAFIRNVDRRLGVASELRFAIDEAFRDAGIEIPFPQRDLHVRTAEGLTPAARPAVTPTVGSAAVPATRPA
jgi:small-conductance mechanosensitive channel